MNPRIGLWVSLLAIAACDVDVEDDSLLIERDSGKQQEDTRAEESTLVADSGPYGPTNSWWHADTVDVPPSLSGTGYGYGDTAFDFTLIDQHGDPVQLYQFYGQVIVLELFAEWCYACQGLTETGQALWEQHSDDDFVFISVMVDNGTNKPPSHQDVNTWASRFDLTHPVLADTVGQQHNYIQIGYPTMVVIDRDMTILEPDMWPVDEDWISSLLR